MEIIKCKNCNKNFKPSRPNKIYCCTKCQNRYYEKNIRKKSPKKSLQVKLKRQEEQKTRTSKGVYTFEEIGYIVTYYNNIKTISEIALDLNRTNQSVEHKIRLLKSNNILSK